MPNPISTAPTPTLASGQGSLEATSFTFTAGASTESSIIVVDREPVKIVSFGVTGAGVITVLQVAGVADSELSEPYVPNWEPLELTADRNEVVLFRSGRYKLQSEGLSANATAFWWPFSMTHEWHDDVAEALRYLCSCVAPKEVTLVSGPGIMIQNLGGGSWRVTNTGVVGVLDSTTVDHTITNGVLNSHVKISEDPENELFARDDGLYASISDPNAPCRLGDLVQPTEDPARLLRFLVLDSRDNCMRWVPARALANYLCVFDCEEGPPPPTNCCALAFSHTLQSGGAVGVGDTRTLTITATGSSALACRAFTNALDIASLQADSNGWRYTGSSFTGANPFTGVDFNASAITTWTLVLEFTAIACSPSGRSINLTATGNCRNSQGQPIVGSDVAYPLAVTLPAVTLNCAEPPPPGSCCNLQIAGTASIPTGPVAVGTTATVQITSTAASALNCHGRLFITALEPLIPTGWVIDSVASTASGQDIRTGINHNTAGLGAITNTIVLRAVACQTGGARSLTVTGACFNSFGSQINDTFVTETFNFTFPTVNSNCSGGGPNPECGIVLSHTETPPPPPVVVGSTYTISFTYAGSNAFENRAKSTATGWPIGAPTGWVPESYSIVGLPPGVDPVVTPVDFYSLGITSFTINFVYRAATVSATTSLITHSIGAFCVNSAGQTIDGSYKQYNMQATLPVIGTGGVGPAPDCCGLNLDIATLGAVVQKCETLTVQIVATANASTAQCAARTEPFSTAILGSAPLGFTLVSTQTLLPNNSPAPFNAQDGVDFRAAGVTGWKLNMVLRATACRPQGEPLDFTVNVAGGCVNSKGAYIAPPANSPLMAIVLPAYENCAGVCP